MNSSPLNLLISLVGFALFWFGYKGLTTGVAGIKGIFSIPKKEKSTPYWITVIAFIVVGIAAVIFGLTSA